MSEATKSKFKVGQTVAVVMDASEFTGKVGTVVNIGYANSNAKVMFMDGEQATIPTCLLEKVVAMVTTSLPGVFLDMTGEALACSPDLTLAVRRTEKDEYAVFRTKARKNGSYYVLKVLPTAGNARDYMAACTR